MHPALSFRPCCDCISTAYRDRVPGDKTGTQPGFRLRFDTEMISRQALLEPSRLGRVAVLILVFSILQIRYVLTVSGIVPKKPIRHGVLLHCSCCQFKQYALLSALSTHGIVLVPLAVGRTHAYLALEVMYCSARPQDPFASRT